MLSLEMTPARARSELVMGKLLGSKGLGGEAKGRLAVDGPRGEGSRVEDRGILGGGKAGEEDLKFIGKPFEIAEQVLGGEVGGPAEEGADDRIEDRGIVWHLDAVGVLGNRRKIWKLGGDLKEARELGADAGAEDAVDHLGAGCRVEIGPQHPGAPFPSPGIRGSG